MDKSTRILCVCEKGNVRSVGTARRLKDRRHFTNVIAIGARNTGSETLKMLCDWAEVILCAQRQLVDLLPVGREKVDLRFTIGPDVYGNPTSPQLQKVIGEQLDQVGLG